MESANDTQTIRRPRRSKADIEEAIMKAAVAQIKKKGFSLALVTDIVKKAKIEPIVFYNRYKNLEDFFDEFVKKYDYWLSDFARGNLSDLENPEKYGDFLGKLMTALVNDAVMTEILRWEISEGNHITERTAKLRELHSKELLDCVAGLEGGDEVDAQALVAIAVAGIFYLILHKDRSTFCGIDLNSDEGKKRVTDACGRIGELVFCGDAVRRERERIAANLRASGVSQDIIDSALAR
ncbi:MAG: TetR/AcrR family transcriptional regulator [[Clostridium] fimetarium]|nr:TetR/AcrR family transcriptional regulator [Alistipes timonensis]MCM1406436.1 TetR/AcrR family transcriptional regulator [[Clostridium] fimetarium]